MSLWRFSKTLIATAAILALAACNVAPKLVKPKPELPATWAMQASGNVQITDGRWWTVYGDPVLDRLVDEALANNANLMVATARVDEARATLKGTAADETPFGTFNFSGSRSRQSERTSQQFSGNNDLTRNNFRAAFDASYELDLWHKLRNATRAARADLLATEAARETVRITLTSDVAQGYFALRSLDDQIAATRRSIATSSESLEIQRKRVALGAISEYEYRQRESEVAQQRAQLPILERARAQQENALAVLLGRSPKAIYEGSVDAGKDPEKPGLVVAVPSGLPSDLLLRRPDIVQAEQQLIAANARIGVARAYYFPSISLTGYLGGESSALGSLFSGPALVWQIAAGLTQPLFLGGRIDAAVAEATARQQQALAQYQGAIQNAFREVRDALIAQTTAREQLEAETQRVESLRETLRLARIRYSHGLASQLDVLLAERGLLTAEQNRADALRAHRAAIADLFKALGGSWSQAAG